MRITLGTLTIFTNLSLCACETNTYNNNETIANNDSALVRTKETIIDSNEKVLSDSVIWRLSEIAYGDYSLKVESFYLDDDVSFRNEIIDNVVLKQEASFYYKDSLLDKITLPVKILNVTTEKGSPSPIKIQENNISTLAIVNGDKGWFYKISGAGVLGTQSEFYGAYTSTGKLLWFSYATAESLEKENKDYPNEDFGDLDKTLLDYGTTEAEFNKPQTTVDIGLFK
jgi:hypothetical protein